MFSRNVFLWKKFNDQRKKMNERWTFKSLTVQSISNVIVLNRKIKIEWRIYIYLKKNLIHLEAVKLVGANTIHVSRNIFHFQMQEANKPNDYVEIVWVFVAFIITVNMHENRE